jgi:hypothetical protein
MPDYDDEQEWWKRRDLAVRKVKRYLRKKEEAAVRRIVKGSASPKYDAMRQRLAEIKKRKN